MGKSKNILRYRDLEFKIPTTISRDHFKAAIEAGIDAAKQVDPNYPIPYDELRRIGATAQEMDYGSWKCKDSCGCPMTNVGVVTVLIEPGSSGSDEVIASPVTAFAGAYDDVIVEHANGAANHVLIT